MEHTVYSLFPSHEILPLILLEEPVWIALYTEHDEAPQTLRHVRGQTSKGGDPCPSLVDEIRCVLPYPATATSLTRM
jgi:hypothetical protein